MHERKQKSHAIDTVAKSIINCLYSKQTSVFRGNLHLAINSEKTLFLIDFDSSRLTNYAQVSINNSFKDMIYKNQHMNCHYFTI